MSATSKDVSNRITAPNGSNVVYLYDDNGDLILVRDLVTGTGSRYGYDNGKLVTAVASGGEGVVVVYGENGSVSEEPVKQDLAGAATFQGQMIDGSIGIGDFERYIFSVRQSEIDATPRGELILRVAATGTNGLNVATPSIAGLTPLTVERLGNQVVALFVVDQEGQYLLSLGGQENTTGDYSLTVGMAGDLDDNGFVDGADADLFAVGNAAGDINGDGEIDVTDRSNLIRQLRLCSEHRSSNPIAVARSSHSR